MDFPIRRKSHGRNISGAAEHHHDLSLEHLPILSDHRNSTTSTTSTTSSSEDHGEIIVNIDGSSSNPNVPSSDHSPSLWRQSSYEFWTDHKAGEDSEDLEEDREMSDVERYQSNHPPHVNLNNNNNAYMENNRSSAKDLKVSFQTPSKSFSEDDNDNNNRNNAAGAAEDSVSGRCHPRRLPSNASVAFSNAGGDRDEVLKCTSFQRRPSVLLTTKTVSRLSDPPLPLQRSDRVAASGPLKSGRASGILEKVPPLDDDDDDDEIFIDDVPDDFKKAKLDALTLLQWISLVLIVTADFRKENLRNNFKEKEFPLHL